MARAQRHLCCVTLWLTLVVTSSLLSPEVDDDLEVTREITGNSTVAGIPDGDANLNGRFCADQCGSNQHLPCDCTPGCVIYNTCCWDVAQSCDDNWREGQREFGPLMSSTSECDGSGLFFITSCPMTAWPTERVKKTWTLDDLPLPLRHAISADSSSPTSLSHVIANVPVTDLVHGMTYVNFSVFACGSHPDAVPGFWRPVIAQEADPIETDFTLVDNQVNQFWYLPPGQLKRFSFMCQSQSISTCMDFADEPARRNCESGAIAYVIEKRRRPRMFRNEHCAFCNNITRDQIKHTGTNKWMFTPKNRHAFDFEIAMSISSQAVSLQLVSRRSWSKATCHSSEGRLEGAIGKLECTLRKCRSQYTLSPNGLCLTRREIWLGFELPAQFTEVQLPVHGLTTMVTCVLTSLGYVIKPPVTMFQANMSRGQDIVVFTMASYFTHKNAFPIINNKNWFDSRIGLESLGDLIRLYIAAVFRCGFKAVAVRTYIDKIEKSYISHIDLPYSNFTDTSNAERILHADMPPTKISISCKDLVSPDSSQTPWYDVDHVEVSVSNNRTYSLGCCKAGEPPCDSFLSWDRFPNVQRLTDSQHCMVSGSCKLSPLFPLLSVDTSCLLLALAGLARLF